MREEDLSPKVKALYDAVLHLIKADMDVKEIKVSDITDRAGIGKGTAYEYFDNKEEIISSALLYYIDRICRHIMERLSETEDFSDMLYVILDYLDEEIENNRCFIKFVHLVTDSGPISRMIHKGIREKDGEICMPEKVVDMMITKGIKNGSIKNEFPYSYMSIAVMAKILVYAFYITDEASRGEYSKAEMKKLICGGLVKELN